MAKVEFSLKNSGARYRTPDITGAGYEYDFTWLYILETGYSILVQCEDTTQVYNSGETDGGARVRTSPLDNLNVKLGFQLDYISVFSILLVFSRLLLFEFFGSV